MDGGVYIVYTDILFLINFILDFICLLITARLLNRPAKLYRLGIAAALGGIYTVISFSLEGWYFLFLHLAAAAILCLVSCGKRGIVKTWAVFIVTSAVLGGGLSAIYALGGKYADYNGGFYTEINPLLLIIFAVLAALAALAYLTLGKKRINTVAVEADLVHGRAALCLNLLVDSGCLARDPISGLCVIIVAAEALEPFIQCQTIQEEALEVLGKSARIIPIKTAAGSKLLPAFKPEKLFIKNGKNERSVAAVIAIDNENKSFSGYDGIAPLEIL